jgi:hypothetical protein
MRDAGFEMRDTGCGMRDAGYWICCPRPDSSVSRSSSRQTSSLTPRLPKAGGFNRVMTSAVDGIRPFETEPPRVGARQYGSQIKIVD